MKLFRILFFSLLFMAIVCFGQTKYRKYVVRKKASIETVAFLNDVTPDQVLLANPTFNPKAKLQPGTVVNIPVDAESVPVVVEQKPQQDVKAPVAEQQVPAPVEVQQPPVQQKKTETQVPSINPKTNDTRVVDDGLIAFNSSQKTINIVAILPFENSSLSHSMAELYSGMVIAASDMSENSDYEISLKAYSTENVSDEYLDKILSSADVIVGPVHKEIFSEVALWAKKNHKPIVSPLSAFDVKDNSYVICVPPIQNRKSDPISDFLSGDKNVVLIEHSVYPNKQLLSEFKKIAPNAKKLSYVREAVTPQDLIPLMDRNKENIVLVPTDHQGAIEDLLSKITAVNSPVKLYNISIIGSSSWLNLSNFSQDLLFKGNVSCVSSYFFDRKDNIVSTLFDDYINAYERIPGRFAMRGYDIVDIVANSLQKWGSEMLVKMEGEDFVPLQTPYHFSKNETNGNIQNEKWMMVSYGEDYTISIK